MSWNNIFNATTGASAIGMSEKLEKRLSEQLREGKLVIIVNIGSVINFNYDIFKSPLQHRLHIAGD